MIFFIVKKNIAYLVVNKYIAYYYLISKIEITKK